MSPAEQPSPLDPGVPRATLRPIPRWQVVTYVAGGVASTVAIVTVLWWAGTRGLTGSELVTARLDALRVGLSIAVGGGGVFALYLAWRRQRATEVDLDNRERALAHQLLVAADTKAHQERVALATEKDAEDRRITDLYTKAVEQLGSEKAAVRFGGMYALDRLAQDNPEQRATIVDVWCAYLRMPFTPPEDDDSERMQEREVRLAVQRLLARHLDPGDDPDDLSPRFWSGVGLDLTGATLIDFSLARCRVNHALFRSATFLGRASFGRSTFKHVAGFSYATFTDDADFERTTFLGNAMFRSVTFSRDTNYKRAAFRRFTNFDSATFDGHTDFEDATFKIRPNFSGTTFRHEVPQEVRKATSSPEQ